MTYAPNSLLLVIPPVLLRVGDHILIDKDFSNNLAAYLQHFDTVTVACPSSTSDFTFPSVCEISDIPGYDRLKIVVLPFAYREDIYLFHRWRIGKRLRQLVRESEYLLISPHAGLDWSTLAAEICIGEGIPYNMEADWNLPEVRRFMIGEMAPGLKKARASLLGNYHDKKYRRILQHSALALLQGGDVYHDFVGIAPNAHSVLNVQITQADRISPGSLERKLAEMHGKFTPKIVYTGRASDIKGPQQWIEVVARLRDAGCHFQAIWAGDGERLEEMRDEVTRRQLGEVCRFVGKLKRADARRLVESAHIFMFCHMAKESPRCLVEALALGTPIVGFGSAYSRELVVENGGGVFVERGDTDNLADQMMHLIKQTTELQALIKSAAVSGRQLDRDQAIEHRIALMKAHLSRR